MSVDILFNSFDLDMSQPSLGGEQHERDEDTPPVSPSLLCEGTSGTAVPKQKQGLFSQKSAPAFTRKYQESSLDADDTESELVAIPESDLSESTLHNSSAPVFNYYLLLSFINKYIRVPL